MAVIINRGKTGGKYGGGCSTPKMIKNDLLCLETFWLLTYWLGHSEDPSLGIECHSQAQNATLKISEGTFHPSLYMAINYILFFLKAHFSQICTYRHKICLRRPVLWHLIFCLGSYAIYVTVFRHDILFQH